MQMRPRGLNARQAIKRIAQTVPVALCLLPALGAQEISPKAGSLIAGGSAEYTTDSGLVSVPLVSPDGQTQDSSDLWNAGKVDLSGLEPGHHTITVKVGAPDLGGVSEPLVLDVFIYDDDWQHSDPETDMDRDGLPDQWELDNFGTLSNTGAADPDADGLTNLEELSTGSRPGIYNEPADGAIFAEYFINTDPGVGRAMPWRGRSDDTPADCSDWQMPSIDTSALTLGHHQIGIRLRKGDNTWAPVRRFDFFVYEDTEPAIPEEKSVVEIESYWEHFVSEGGGLPLTLREEAVSTDAVSLAAGSTREVIGIAEGWTRHYLRALDATGEYGSLFGNALEIGPAETGEVDAELAIDSILGVTENLGDNTVLVGASLTAAAPHWYDYLGQRYALEGAIGTGTAQPYLDEGDVFGTTSGWSSLTWLWARSRDSVSFVDERGFGQGGGNHYRYSTVRASVPEYVYENADTRYRSIGYTAVGSGLVAGDSNEVSFMLMEATTITWLWEKQYRVQLYGRSGQVDGWTEWYAEGSDTMLRPLPDDGYVFDSWGGALAGSSANPGVFTVIEPASVLAHFKPAEDASLRIIEIDGSERTIDYSVGSLITLSPEVLGRALADRVREVPSGWKIEGSFYGEGAGLNPEFYITRPTVLRWQATRQIYLEPIAIPEQGGEIIVEGKQTGNTPGWYDSGRVQLRASNAAGFRFVEWYPQEWPEDTVEFNLFDPIPVVARFAEVRALGQFVTVDGGNLSSPNSLVAHFEPTLPTTRFKQQEVTAGEYAAFLNSALDEGYIEASNYIGVRGQNPLREKVTGLQADWFEGNNWSGDPALSGELETLALDFGLLGPSSLPATGVSGFDAVDFFTVRARGEIWIQSPGAVNFRVSSTDECIVVFDSSELLNASGPITNEEVTVTVAEAGWYPFEVIFMENVDTASFSVDWDAGALGSWEAIDAQYLRHEVISERRQAQIAYYKAHVFYDGIELLDLDTADVNIELIDGVFTPKIGAENLPVVDVTYFGALAYCDWLSWSTGESVNLPSEFAWEYAASGGDSNSVANYYPWGPVFLGVIHSKANYSGVGGIDIYNGLSPVGTFPLYSNLNDMAGNVFEWTTSINEVSDQDTILRMLRGGSWNQPSSFLATSNRQIYKNEGFSDQATGFRPIVEYKPDFDLEGYLFVDTSNAVASTNVDAAAYSAPADPYYLAYDETNHRDYAAFLNWALAKGYVAIQGERVVGSDATWLHNGELFYQIDPTGGISDESGAFKVRSGWEQQSVNFVTWFGADAYCAYLESLDPSRDYSLPTEWEWEYALLGGSGDARFEDRDYFGDNLPVATDPSFWTAFWNVREGVQEWTKTVRTDLDGAWSVLRGGADNLYSGFQEIQKTQQYVLSGTAHENVGFRVAIRKTAPQIKTSPEPILLSVNGESRTVALTGHSLKTNPVWNWNLSDAPDWVTLSEASAAQSYLEFVPPSTETSGQFVVSLSDGGGVQANLDIRYQVGSGDLQLIRGLPSQIETHIDGPQQDYILEIEVDASVDRSGLSWSLSEPVQGLSITSLSDGSARLNVSGGAVGAATVNVNVSGSGYSASQEFTLLVLGESLHISAVPEQIVFKNNDDLLSVVVLARSQSPDASLNWNVVGVGSAWAQFIDAVGHSAILEVNRSGFTDQSALEIQLSDGISTDSAKIEVIEENQLVRTLTDIDTIDIVAGQVAEQILLIYGDENTGDELEWTLANAPEGSTITKLSDRSAILTIVASGAGSASEIVVSVTDGISSTSHTIGLVVGNTAPVLVEGSDEWLVDPDVDGGGRFFTLFDPDYSQDKRIELADTPAWLDWYYVSKGSIWVQPNEVFEGSRDFTIRLTDGFDSVDNLISLSYPDYPVLSLDSPTNAIRLERFSPRKKVPLKLNGVDTSSEMVFEIISAPEGIHLESGELYHWDLVVDAIAAEGDYRIVFRAHSEAQDEYFTIDLTIGANSNLGHELSRAEYFVDVEPSPGSGKPLFIEDNKIFQDASSYVALITNTEDLALGHHRIGFRVQSSDMTWSSVYWSDFFVYDTAERVGVLVERPDGNLSYGRWPEFSGFGTTGGPSGGTISIGDLNPGETLVNTGEYVVEDTDGLVDIQNTIHWGEYFIDADPGVGLATPMPLDSRDFESDDLSVQFDFDSSRLERGAHVVGIRLKEISGEWSETRYVDVIVYVDEDKEIPENVSIVDTEYFWDEPGSEGFGFSLPLSDAVPVSEIGLIASEPLQTSSVDTGIHTLGYRFKTNTNEWSQNRIELVEVALEDAPLSLFNLHLESNLGLPGLNLDSLHISGTSINLHVPKTYDLDGLIYANFGFIGQGSAPSFGQENFVSFVLTEASDITWIWGRDCQVTGRTGLETISGTAPWIWYNDFDTGYAVFEPLQEVTLSVPEFSAINDSERYRSNGWLGTGSIPSVGFDHTVTFTALAESSEIDWLWRKQYRVISEVVGRGEVFGNREWYDEDGLAELLAIASEGYQFRRWELDLAGTNSDASLTIDQTKTIRAVFTEHRLWEVDPVTLERRLIGTYEEGELVEHAIAESHLIAVGSRLMVDSWRGAGSAPSSGLGNSVSFQIFEDSEIRWDGVRQHWVDVRVNSPELGNIYFNQEAQPASSGWVTEGNLSLEALPENGSRFVRWLDGLNGKLSNQDLMLISPLVLSAVFRDADVNPPEMVEIKGRSISESSNREVAGFTEWIESFELGKYEVTNQFIVDELNRALNEGSIYVSENKVYGKSEFMPYWLGVLVESYEPSSLLVSDYKRVSTLSNLDLTSNLDSFEGDSYKISGEAFTHSQQVSADWLIEGSGKVSLIWNGVTVLDESPLPASVSLDTSDEWVEFALIYTSDSAVSPSCNVDMQISPSVAELSIFEFRHKDPGYNAPQIFTRGKIGQTAEVAAAGARFVYYDRDVVIPSIDTDFTYIPLNSDGSLVVDFNRPVSSDYGLMVRSSLSEDAAFVEVSVDSAGQITTTTREIQGGAVSSSVIPFRLVPNYTIKLGVYAGVVTAQVLIDGRWIDVVSQTLEILPLPVTDASIAESQVIGFVGGKDIRVNEWTLLNRSPRHNHINQILFNLDRQNGSIIFDSSAFLLNAPASSQLPVVGINYLGASQVCSWLSQRFNDYTYQLPSEWEIEAATGVGVGYEFPWPVDSSFVGFANLSDSEKGIDVQELQAVGSFNDWNGVHDIAGNAWEWTRSPQIQGRGPWFTIRGGSYSQDVAKAANVFRLFYGDVNFASPEVGFRLSRKQSVSSDFGFGIDDDLVSVTNADVLGFGAYGSEFDAIKHPVSNGDFSAFLNALLEQREILNVDGQIYSESAEYFQGELLIDLGESRNIIYTEGLFSASFAHDSVTGVTWHGANAYGSWLSSVRGDGLYVLPSEWEWELLSGAGVVASENDLVDYSTATSAILGYGYIDGVYPSWGISSLVSGPGEWVANEYIGDSSYAAARGVHLDQFSQLSEPDQRYAYFPKSHSADDLGFRLIKKSSSANRTLSEVGNIIFELDKDSYAPGDSGRVGLLFLQDAQSSLVINAVSSNSRLVIDGSILIPAGERSSNAEFKIADTVNIYGVDVASVAFSVDGQFLGEIEVPIRNSGTPSLGLSSSQIELHVGQNTSLQVDKSATLGVHQPVYLSGSAVGAFNLPDRLGFNTNPSQEILNLLASTENPPGLYYLNFSNPDFEPISAIITVIESIDFDLDGMPDWWEIEHGSDEKTYNPSADEDRDGMGNLDEYTFGTDPSIFNQKPKLEFIRSGNGVSLFFDSSVNRRYMLQVSTDLEEWFDAGQEISNADSINIDVTLSGKKFYRLKVYP